MKKLFSHIGRYLRRIYRFSLNAERQEAILVKDILKLHRDADWHFGYFEKQKLIRSGFEVDKGVLLTYNFLVVDQYFHCRVKVLEAFPEESTEQLFILAAHFNNLLIDGVVVVDAEERYVDYRMKQTILLPLLYIGELYKQIRTHFDASKDIYRAFDRLITEHEAPAIIIADLLRNRSHDLSE